MLGNLDDGSLAMCDCSDNSGRNHRTTIAYTKATSTGLRVTLNIAGCSWDLARKFALFTGALERVVPKPYVCTSMICSSKN